MVITLISLSVFFSSCGPKSDGTPINRVNRDTIGTSGTAVLPGEEDVEIRAGQPGSVLLTGAAIENGDRANEQRPIEQIRVELTGGRDLNDDAVEVEEDRLRFFAEPQGHYQRDDLNGEQVDDRLVLFGCNPEERETIISQIDPNGQINEIEDHDQLVSAKVVKAIAICGIVPIANQLQPRGITELVAERIYLFSARLETVSPLSVLALITLELTIDGENKIISDGLDADTTPNPGPSLEIEVFDTVATESENDQLEILAVGGNLLESE